jgi:serine/threonine-protein kinase
MPPLHGPPVDGDARDPYDHPYDDDYYPEDEPPRRRRWPWLVAGLVALLLVAGGVWYALNRDGSSGSGSGRTSTTSAPASAGDVLVDTKNFIGQDADVVQKSLEDKGLRVTQQNATSAQLHALGVALGPGTVAGSTPADQPVPKGSHVTLLVAPNGYNPGGGASTTTAAPTTTAARTTTPPPTKTTTSAAPTTTTSTSTSTSTSVSLPGQSAPGSSSSPGTENGAAGSPPAPGVGP